MKKQKDSAEISNENILSSVPLNWPGLPRAAELGDRASRQGFDWPNRHGARAKINEELAELDEAVEGGDQERITAEAGDVLFAVVNLCRHLGVDPEQAVRGTNRRFEQRFGHVERRVAASGRSWNDHALDELDAYWDEAKRLAHNAEYGAGPES